MYFEVIADSHAAVAVLQRDPMDPPPSFPCGTNAEQQGETRKPSSAISAKKQRKTTECERPEIASRKLEIPREHFMQRNVSWAQLRVEMVWIKHK